MDEDLSCFSLTGGSNTIVNLSNSRSLASPDWNLAPGPCPQSLSMLAISVKAQGRGASGGRGRGSGGEGERMLDGNLHSRGSKRAKKSIVHCLSVENELVSMWQGMGIIILYNTVACKTGFPCAHCWDFLPRTRGRGPYQYLAKSS